MEGVLGGRPSGFASFIGSRLPVGENRVVLTTLEWRCDKAGADNGASLRSEPALTLAFRCRHRNVGLFRRSSAHLDRTTSQQWPDRFDLLLKKDSEMEF